MKTAVIGTGRMGRRHIQVVKELGLELVGVCDRREDALALSLQEQGVPSALHYTDPAILLKSKTPECVIISTTAPSHCELTGLAAKSGAKYILCEKPMAVSLAACNHMIEVCQKYGSRLSINHQMRFMEQYTVPKALLNTPDYGGLTSITVVCGNIGMAMNGTHYFEMFRYMTGEAPSEVTAWFSEEKVSNPRGCEFEDRAGTMRITTSSGKRLFMEINADQGHGMKVIYSARSGQIFVDELTGMTYTTVREAQYRNLPTTRYGTPSVNTTHFIAPADSIQPSKSVLKALLNGENYPTGEEGRLAVATLVAAYISHENGHIPVQIQEKLPVDRIFPWA